MPACRQPPESPKAYADWRPSQPATRRTARFMGLFWLGDETIGLAGEF
jgi:hypothetical protein